MAEFKKVMAAAVEAYSTRMDYPGFAGASWDERRSWTKYLEQLNDELDELNTSPAFGVASDDNPDNDD